MQAVDIVNRKMKLKTQALSVIRQDEKVLRQDIKNLRTRKVLLELKRRLESEMQEDSFDRELSRKLDAVDVLLEYLRRPKEK